MGLIEAAEPARPPALRDSGEELVPDRRVDAARTVVVGGSADRDTQTTGRMPLQEITAESSADAPLLAGGGHRRGLRHRSTRPAVHVEVLHRDQLRARALGGIG